jgi:hypothetical protein
VSPDEDQAQGQGQGHGQETGKPRRIKAKASVG